MTGSDSRWVVVTAVLLILVRLGLNVARLSTVQKFAEMAAKIGTAGASTRGPEAVGSLVTSVSTRVPKTKCLASSVTAKALLDAQGYDSDLKIGVQKWGGRFYAHAWLESDGTTIVGGYVDVANYDELVGADLAS